MNKHLDNVCIMQKYNDSEKVLELRKEFNESETYIKKCVNMHEEMVAALKISLERIKELDEVCSGITLALDNTIVHSAKTIEIIERSLEKASQ